MPKGDSHCECNGPTPRIGRLQDYWSISVEEIQDVESDFRASKSFRVDKGHVIVIALLYSNAAYDRIIVRTTLRNNKYHGREESEYWHILNIIQANQKCTGAIKRDQAFHRIPNPPIVV